MPNGNSQLETVEIEFLVSSPHVFMFDPAKNDLGYANTCDPDTYYDATSKSCKPCDSSSLTLDLQQNYCTQCSDLLPYVASSDLLYSFYSVFCTGLEENDSEESTTDNSNSS